jgi:hypothetical protein
MFARLAIAHASDMCKDSEFTQILTKADVISVQIQKFLRAMTGSGGPTIPHALKSDIMQRMLRFSAVRSRWVAQIVKYGIVEARLRDLHSQMRTLGRVYAHDDNTLDAFLDSAWKQLLTQSAQYTHLPTREAYCTRAFLCMAQAFICGLKSGPAPVNPNVLDTLTGEAIGGGVGALRTGGASATSSSSGTPQCTVQCPLQGTAASPLPPPAPVYSTIQHPLALAYAPSPIEQEPSLDTMARQTTAGYRLAGPLLNGISGGGAEGIDLLPQARRVLHAQQVLLGIRAPGPLTSTPPAVGLPTLASYAPILYSSGAAAAGAVLPPPVGPPPPLYSTVQTSTGGLGGGGGLGAGAGANGQRRSESTYMSDELCIPYSVGLGRGAL